MAKKKVEDKYIGKTFRVITNSSFTFKQGKKTNARKKSLSYAPIFNNPTVKVLRARNEGGMTGYYDCSVVGKREAFVVHKSTLVTSSAFKKLQKKQPAKYSVGDSIQIGITGEIRKDTIDKVYYRTLNNCYAPETLEDGPQLTYWLKKWTTNSWSGEELYPEDYVFEEHTVVYLEKDLIGNLRTRFSGGPCGGGHIGSALSTRQFFTKDSAQNFIELNAAKTSTILLIKGEIIPIDISTEVKVSFPDES